MHPLYAEMKTTVFEAMSALARANDAINLGQGFPDDPGPRDVLERAAAAVLDGWNQYPPMMGLPELRQAMTAHYRRFQDLELDWQAETLVTSGATEALAASLFALIEHGDEVVLIQPMYDAYLPLVRRAGGVPRFVTLRPPSWRLDEEALRRAVSPKTRVILVNTPLNPAGRVFSPDECALLGTVAAECDAVVVSDEVWEHVVFAPARHHTLLAVPGLRERCVKIGSAGKIFSLTGWKVGLVAAAPGLLQGIAKAHQFLTFTTPPNLQSAVAYGLGKPDVFFEGLAGGLAAKRDHFAGGLERAGFSVLPCEGTYFLNLDLDASGIALDDLEFCRLMVNEGGVAAIPVSAFYAEQAPSNVVRFCFAKSDATLDAAIERISAFRKRMASALT
ncbi:aminotransferase [Marinivivus vitaminiproducens]|uniref:aminotransferase n=1 Tax=Marinivivus vitaminiproducens TaxID=3035935 RepID=UPI0027A5B52C|nr:aminotransferase [Geminicoccaceae bacterium SCSIO 64248]